MAHRLNTLLDYDVSWPFVATRMIWNRLTLSLSLPLSRLAPAQKIIVLSQGQLVEEGHPDELRKNTMGPFSQLLRGEQNSAAGQEQSDDITEL